MAETLYPTTIYPTLQEALYLHKLLIERFGGSAEVIDLGLLESALARPKSGYYQSLSAQAAALLQSLALNHPFADDNKRLAFALTAVFLRQNGYQLKVKPKPAVHFIETRLIAEHAALVEITSWLENHMQSL